ncbi:hypothetical protein Vadar_020054 [Vaccinium darrowii]|uniref:Uncharacterized protein n=1 Tax=Vaccinium darrowii TaxID=229202 RepID=A0ACB7XAZ0_9ERIC|nr:hypothetical protein Vadar_020054 [Vaccinium darrowii]
MADLFKNHNPDFLVLVETKVPFATLNEFFKSKGFTARSYSDPVGRSGGIWVLWDPARVNVSVVEVTNQQRAANDNREWLVAGDFNDHAESSEKRCYQRGTCLVFTLTTAPSLFTLRGFPPLTRLHAPFVSRICGLVTQISAS